MKPSKIIYRNGKRFVEYPDDKVVVMEPKTEPKPKKKSDNKGKAD
jgi:hypothetical protein